MAIVTKISWNDMFAGKALPESPVRRIFRECVEVMAKQARISVTALNGRTEKAVQLVLSGDVSIAPDGQGKIASQSNSEIHGKMFVQYAGLLAMAHECGLISLSANFITVSGDLALPEATATFADGKVFKACADSTPSHVNPKVKQHFPRMALTRAKARCLRDALNISVCSVEEMET